MEITELITMDAQDYRVTRDGYLTANPRVARAGVQLYAGREVGKPNLEVVRVLRPVDEVFHVDSLRSYSCRPVTNNHPPVQVTADNWKQFSVGQTGEDVARDGETIRTPMVVMDAAAIADIKNGKSQLSLGYTCDLKWEPGTTESGEAYDAIQQNIRANHLAIVQVARGGPALKIGDNHGEDTTMTFKTITIDGVDCQVADASAQYVSKQLDTLKARIDALQSKVNEAEEDKKKEKTAKDEAIADSKKQVETKDAEIATLKQQLADSSMTPQKLDQMVKDRAVVIDKAKLVLGDTIVVDGKTEADVRRQVVDAKLGDVAKGWSDDQVSASFNTLTAGLKASDAAFITQDTGRAFGTPGLPTTQHAASDAAYGQMVNEISNAWRKPAKVA